VKNRLKLFAIVGWCLAVVGIVGLCLALWADSKKSAYAAALDRVAEKLVSQIEESSSGGGLDVVPFSDYSGRTSQVGLFLADYLGNSLQNRAKNFYVLERASLEEILREQKFAMGGLVDPQTSVQVGKIEAAKMLLFGKIDLHQRRIALVVRVVDVRTAKNIASASSTIVATTQMEQLWQQSLTAVNVSKVAQEIRRQQQVAVKENSEREALKSVGVDFFVKNWPWLWTVLLVPVFTWLIGKLRRKKREPETEAITKDKAA
jgi:curli biogenesis system outer membrane secretion channel CsgG